MLDLARPLIDTHLFPAEDELDEIVVGPESVSWRRVSDSRLNLVMLYPLLLQVAHPTVGAGVRDHSNFEEDPWTRLRRTADYLSLLVYGGREAAPAGRRVRALHQRFRGVREDGEHYSALEPDAYAWVHATLVQAYVAGHAHFGTPLRGAELDRFYREYRGLGRLIGVRERDLPADWEGFREYFERTATGTLVRTEAVEQVLRVARRPAPPPFPLPVPGLVWRAMSMPAARASWLGGAGLLGSALRARLGIRWSIRDEAAFQTLGVLCRSLTPIMPERLRVTGPAQLRWRRQAIARGPLGSQTGVSRCAADTSS